MKKRLFLAASSTLLAASILGFASSMDSLPYPGSIAPNLTLPDLGGKNWELRKLYSEKPLWLTLYTTWCPECLIETPELVSAQSRYPGIQFVSISLFESPEDVRDFQKRYQVPYPMLVDEEGMAADAYNIRPIPVNIGIKKGGEIAFRRQTVTREEIEELAPVLLGAHAPTAVTASKPASSSPLEKLFSTLPLAASFLAGVLSFVSPCILPLIPVYIALITGASLEKLLEHEQDASWRGSLVFSTFVFTLGFGLVFTSMGATASVLGQTIGNFQAWLRWIGGGVMVAFGLHLSGALTLMPLYREFRFQPKGRRLGPLGAFIMGLVFATGWTPCVGPILSTILIYTASEADLGKGISLLGAYSLGIGIPFLLTSLFLGRFHAFLNKVKPYFRQIEVASGALLIILGFLLITNKFAFIVSYFPGLSYLG